MRSALGRLVWLARAVQEQGHQVEVILPRWGAVCCCSLPGVGQRCSPQLSAGLARFVSCRSCARFSQWLGKARCRSAQSPHALLQEARGHPETHLLVLHAVSEWVQAAELIDIYCFEAWGSASGG